MAQQKPHGQTTVVVALFRPELPDTVMAAASMGSVDASLFARVLERFGA